MNDSARKSRHVPLITTRGCPTALISGRPAALPRTYTSPPLAPYMNVCPTSPWITSLPHLAICATWSCALPWMWISRPSMPLAV